MERRVTGGTVVRGMESNLLRHFFDGIPLKKDGDPIGESESSYAESSIDKIFATDTLAQGLLKTNLQVFHHLI